MTVEKEIHALSPQEDTLFCQSEGIPFTRDRWKYFMPITQESVFYSQKSQKFSFEVLE